MRWEISGIIGLYMWIVATYGAENHWEILDGHSEGKTVAVIAERGDWH